MKNVLIYKNPDVAVVHFVDDLTIEQVHDYAEERLEGGVKYTVVATSELPDDRVFREAWDINESALVNTVGGLKSSPNGTISVDLQKSKDVVHKARRQARAEEFAPYDEIISKQIPNNDTDVAESKRADIRVKYADLQTQIDSCENVIQLKEKLQQLNAI